MIEAFGPSRQEIFVDTAVGSNSNSGSRTSPLASVNTAAAVLALCGGGRIVLRAPAATPFVGHLRWQRPYPLSIVAWDDDEAYWRNTVSNCAWVDSNRDLFYLEGLDMSCPDTSTLLLGLSTAVASSGFLHAVDCLFHHSGVNGVATQGIWSECELENCDLSDNVVDGAGASCTAGAPVMTIRNCTGSRNGDEWASPHQTTVMHVIGGSTSDNVHGALACSDSAVMHVSDFTSIGDYTAAREGGEGVITYIFTTSSGSLSNVTVQESPMAPGFVVRPASAAVPRTGIVSTGNALPDEWAA